MHVESKVHALPSSQPNALQIFRKAPQLAQINSEQVNPSNMSGTAQQSGPASRGHPPQVPGAICDEGYFLWATIVSFIVFRGIFRVRDWGLAFVLLATLLYLLVIVKRQTFGQMPFPRLLLILAAFTAAIVHPLDIFRIALIVVSMYVAVRDPVGMPIQSEPYKVHPLMA